MVLTVCEAKQCSGGVSAPLARGGCDATPSSGAPESVPSPLNPSGTVIKTAAVGNLKQPLPSRSIGRSLKSQIAQLK